MNDIDENRLQWFAINYTSSTDEEYFYKAYISKRELDRYTRQLSSLRHSARSNQNAISRAWAREFELTMCDQMKERFKQVNKPEYMSTCYTNRIRI